MDIDAIQQAPGDPQPAPGGQPGFREGTVHVVLLSTGDVLLEPVRWKGSSYQACEVGAAAGGPPVLAKGSYRMKQPRCVERQPFPPSLLACPPSWGRGLQLLSARLRSVMSH